VAPGRLRFLGMSVLLVAVGLTPQAPSPELGGIRLGSTARNVRDVLGPPDRTQESIGMRFWDYERRGITVIWREGESGVHAVVASRAAAGDVDDVRVGDSEALLRRQWGAPARTRQRGRFLDFLGARWVLSVELREGTVVQMTLMGTTDAAP